MSSRRWHHLAGRGALVAILVGCGLQPGRAPAAISSISLGSVEVGVPEPRLQEDLGRALAREAAARTHLGEGPGLSAHVIDATASPAAPGGGVWEAHLVVRFHLATEPPVEVLLSGQRLFDGDPESWRATDVARADAFDELAAQLAAEAVPFLLATPMKGDSP